MKSLQGRHKSFIDEQCEIIASVTLCFSRELDFINRCFEAQLVRCQARTGFRASDAETADFNLLIIKKYFFESLLRPLETIPHFYYV